MPKKAQVRVPTLAGRHRAAIRDAMAWPSLSKLAFHDDIEKLAKALSLSRGMQIVDERAREAAGAELDLLRIRKVPAWVFETYYFVANDATSGSLAELNEKLAKLERYERRAFSRRNRALREM
jgi:hypothetical protein